MIYHLRDCRILRNENGVQLISECKLCRRVQTITLSREGYQEYINGVLPNFILDKLNGSLSSKDAEFLKTGVCCARTYR